MLNLFKKHPYLTLFILALLLRMGFIFTLGGRTLSPARDQDLYRYLATSLVTRGEIMVPGYIQEIKVYLGETLGEHPWMLESDMAVGTVPVDTPTSMWDPLYIVLYAGVLGMGIKGLLGMRLLNVMFGAVTAVLGYKTGLMLGGKRTGWIVGLALVLYPYYIYYTGLLMPETLNFMLLAAVMCVLIIATYRLTIWWSIALGVLIGLLALTRSNIILFIPFLLLYIFLYKIRKGLIVKKLLSILIVLAAFLAIMSPWIIRNYDVHGRLMLIPNRSGINLWMRNNPDAIAPELAAAGQSIPPQMLDNLREKELLQFPNFTQKDEIERDEILQDRMMRFIAANPGYFAYMCWLRLGDFLAVVGPNIRGLAVTVAGWLSYGVALVFSILSLWFLRRRFRELWVFYALILYYIVSHTLLHGGIQYRLPIDQFFVLLAALTISRRAEHLFRLKPEKPQVPDATA
jgi:4-amino-4-deoxy-L-arabinose transferase-like glycosyltransferase